MTVFTRDYTTCWMNQWASLLHHFRGKACLNAMEIGSFEGRSTLWFLENILSHATSKITCVDPAVEPSFHNNLRPHQAKITLIAERAAHALRRRELQFETFHFIYVDAELGAASVLENLVLAFPLLKKNGVMIVDGYRWRAEEKGSELRRPELGVNAFLSVYSNLITVLNDDWQLTFRKTV